MVHNIHELVQLIQNTVIFCSIILTLLQQMTGCGMEQTGS
jgi:hypothetical protein